MTTALLLSGVALVAALTALALWLWLRGQRGGFRGPAALARPDAASGANAAGSRATDLGADARGDEHAGYGADSDFGASSGHGDGSGYGDTSDFGASSGYGDQAAAFAPAPPYGHAFDAGTSSAAHGAQQPLPSDPGTRTIRVRGGDSAQLVLTRGRHSIGRSSRNDLSVEDPSVSRCHAELVLAPRGEYIINDLQSLNGMFVNGKPRRSTRLVPGDLVELGDARLDYLAADDPELL